MHSIVAGAFKAVFFSILFIIVFDIVFYVLRVNVLNNKIDSMLVSMTQDISKNNYLTESAFTLYSSILNDMMIDFDASTNETEEPFFVGWGLNYSDASSSVGKMYGYAWDGSAPKKGEIPDLTVPTFSGLATSGITVRRNLNVPGDYGDIMVLRLGVVIHQNVWYFTPYNANKGAADQIQRRFRYNTYYYTRQIPCLRYVSVKSVT